MRRASPARRNMEILHTWDYHGMKRFRLRYSLRTLLIGMGALACMFAWLGSEVRRANLQHQAVLKITRIGGTIIYGNYIWGYSAQYVDLTDGWVRKGLRRVFGDEFVGIAQSVGYRSGVTESEITALKDLRTVHTVTFLDVTITDKLLLRLSEISSVKSIRFFECKFHDDAFDRLGTFSSLEALYLAPSNPPPHVRVSINNLEKLKNLRKLAIEFAKVDMAELDHVTLSEKLEFLSLSGSQLENVADGGLARLAEYPNLRTLVLCNTNIGNDDILGLKDMRQLKTLYLGDTDVTATGAKVLQSALPDCRIEFASAGPLF